MREYIILFPNKNDKEPFGISHCGITYPDPNYKINRHDSDIWCIEYIYEGEGTVYIDGEGFKAVEGDVYILPAGRNHFYYADSKKPWKKIWFNIYGDFIGNTLRSYGIFSIHHIENINVAPLFEAFIRDAEEIRKKDGDKSDFNACALDFVKIVQAISEKIHSENSKKNMSPEKQLKNRLDGITDFNCSFDDIISDFYYTKSHLIRIFKKKYKITPYDYLLERKISVAKRLLSDTGMSISEVADYLGFNDCHYFSNFFKKRTGITPYEFKNKSIFT